MCCTYFTLKEIIMKKSKKILSISLCLLTIFSLSTSALALDNNSSEKVIGNYSEQVKLPQEEFTITQKENTTKGYVTTYTRTYTRGSLLYGSWRNGALYDGGPDGSTATFNYTYNQTYNNSFTATLSGELFNPLLAGIDLGVTVGSSKSYSFGSGTSFFVPANTTKIAKYRPCYYKYKVVEKKYYEQYVPGSGIVTYLVGTKTGYVNVFSMWHFTNAYY